MVKKYGVSITLDDAKKIAKAAEDRANKIGVPMVISVLDAGGNQVLLYKMQDALLVSIDIAINKAFSALANKCDTHNLAPLVQPGAILYGIQNTERFIAFGGGYVLERNGEIVGAFGVSGGTVPEDMDVAEAGVKAL